MGVASRLATVIDVAMVIPILLTISNIEFYGEWQKVATHHRTQYVSPKVWRF